MTRRATQALVLVSVAIWIAWDLYANQFDGATESEVIRDWQLEHPPIAWGLGVVFGHWTLLGRRLASPLWLAPLTGIVVTLAFLAPMTWHWVPGLALAGTIAGRIFWAQEKEKSSAD